MTPKEIVKANLRHDNPPRPGLTFDRGRLTDRVAVGLLQFKGYTPRRWREGDVEYYDDPWGNIWSRMIDGCRGGEIHRPALAEWDGLDALAVPALDRERAVREARAVFAAEPDKYHIAGIGNWVFATARYLRKLENYLADMALYPDEVHALNRKLAPFFRDFIEVAAATGADAFMFAEDLGTQTNLLFSPAMWDEFYKDLYTELFALVHEAGMSVFMHSCGQNTKLLERLLDAGVDCLQFDQPTVYDPAYLGGLLQRRPGALWSPIDIQRIMPTNDPKIIEEGVAWMFEHYEGGLILGNYGDRDGIGVTEASDNFAYDAIMKRCDFRRG